MTEDHPTMRSLEQQPRPSQEKKGKLKFPWKRIFVGSAAAAALGAEVQHTRAQEDFGRRPTPIIAEDPGYAREENTGLRIAQASEGELQPLPAPTRVAEANLSALTASLSLEQRETFNLISEQLPGGSVDMLLDDAREQGFQTIRWHPDYHAFEATKDGQTYYFYYHLGTEGARGTDERDRDDLEDGWTINGGGFATSDYLPGERGLRLTVFTSRNLEHEGQKYHFTWTDPAIANNQAALDYLGQQLMQQYDDDEELQGKHLILVYAADNITNLGRDLTGVAQRLAEIGGYSANMQGFVTAGRDRITNSVILRASINNRQEEFVTEPRLITLNAFGLAFLPFTAAEHAFVGATALNQHMQRMRAISSAMYDFFGRQGEGTWFMQLQPHR